MTRWLALIWLLAVLVAAGYVVARMANGLPFRSDLLALLPREEHDPLRQRADRVMTDALNRRVLLLVGHPDRHIAREELETAEQKLLEGGVFKRSVISNSAGFGAIAALFSAHRANLLSTADRTALMREEPEHVISRALTQIYNPIAPLSASMLRQDPFLLLPAFIADLPRPSGRATPDAGRLSVTDQGVTWYLAEFQLEGVPTDLDVQERAATIVEAATAAARAREPDLQILRLGAVFFAQAGARSGLNESSWLGGMSLGVTALLLIVVFRSSRPLLQNLLAAGTGILVGLAGSLWIFGDLHIGTLLFGVGLIGVVVDYSLHYSATAFDPAGGLPAERLRRIWPALWLGLLTTLLGYAALAIAPLPGLRQIAVFSLLGLVGAFLCVILWLPILDRQHCNPAEGWAYRASSWLWPYVASVADSRYRWPVLMTLIAIAGTGLAMLRPDDDVRRLQSLSPDLLRQQYEIRRILGAVTEPQFILVLATDDETALRQQEALQLDLEKLRREGGLQGFVMPAAFVPSLSRQAENQHLIAQVLEPAKGAEMRSQLGLTTEQTSPPQSPLTWEVAQQSGALGFLESLRMWPGGHAVILQGLTDAAALRQVLAKHTGVSLVDPAADVTRVLERYRERIQVLLVVSILLLVPVLAWRYGLRGAAWLLIPPVVALALAGGLLGLLGIAFTLFHAMALILILSIGVDYTIFIAESDDNERPVALLGTVLATFTTLLSFGLLALSSAGAVAGFGLTMLVGITAACLLAPLAGTARRTNARMAS